ncbi:MAG: aminopeptidase [Thermoanaerobaculia bacterium]
MAGLVLLVASLTGCARLGYYAHLGKGGFALVARGEKVERLLEDSATPGELRGKLQAARALLEFAETRLLLPVGKRYGKYLDLERPYAVWTVVATPEFSLEPRTWCFPIAGCVGYRGFFDPDRADRFAGSLRNEGLDAAVGGVRAFSSLGWFGDPLLNTFIFDPDRDLAGLLFHELAHSRIYVKGDTVFNESFATAVERAGVRRWLEATSAEVDTEVADYEHSLRRLDHAYAGVERLRIRLEALYADSEMGESARRARKAEHFAEFLRNLETSDPDRTGAFAGWIGRDLNNADLAAIGFYRERLDAFQDLFRAASGDFERFYESAGCLAGLPPDERDRRLLEAIWGDCILADSEG